MIQWSHLNRVNGQLTAERLCGRFESASMRTLLGARPSFLDLSVLSCVLANWAGAGAFSMLESVWKFAETVDRAASMS